MTDSVNDFVARTTLEGGQGPDQQAVDMSHFRGALRDLLGALNKDDPAEAISWVTTAAGSVGANNGWFTKRRAPLHRFTIHQFSHELQKVTNEVRVHSMSSMLIYDGIARSIR
jgi:hypothetical protein